MHNLILKDLILTKKTLGAALFYGIFTIIALQSFPGGQFVATAVGIGYMLMMNATAYDDKNHFEMILNSLPIARSQIVFAKYLSIFVYVGLAFVSYLMAFFIIRIFHLPLSVLPITPVSLICALLTLSLMAGLYFPLYFKMGYLKSNVLKTVIFTVFFFGPLLGFTVLQSNPENGWLRSLLVSIRSLSSAQQSLILCVLTFLFLSLSLGLSLRFYQQREF